MSLLFYHIMDIVSLDWPTILCFTVCTLPHFVMFLVVMLLLFMYVWRRENSKPKCGIVCFFFLFYRDVEGVEPTAQSERVYRPENYCWRQRVWSPPKCSSFLQLVFQGPGEKVCLRFPSHQLLIQSVLFIGRICVAFFSLPLSLLQVCEDFGS